MKKFVVWWLVLSSLMWGDIIVKSGWQLVGLDRDIEDMSIFNNGSVEQVWVYNAASQSWSGYSPDAAIAAKIAASYSTIGSIKSWQGMWIKSTKEWYLTAAVGTHTSPVNKLELQKGWNLISVPVNSTISPEIFKDALAWRYNGESWQVYGGEVNGFGAISGIRSSDGIWIKLSEAKSIDISQESAELRTFASKVRMEAYIKNMVQYNSMPYYAYYYTDGIAVSETSNTATVDDTSGGDTGSNEATDTTTTNLQEEGVLEADALMNDTVYTYYLNKAAHTVDIRELSRLAIGDTSLYAQIELDHDYPGAFYLYSGKLIVLSSFYNNTGYGTQVAVDIYDVADPANPSKIESFVFDGSLSSSRVVDGKLYTVSTFYPYAQVEYPVLEVEGNVEGYPGTCSTGTATVSSDGTSTVTEADCTYDTGYYGYYYTYDYEHPTVTATYLVPQISSTGYSGDLVTYDTFYAPYKLNQTPTITTIASFDLGTAKYLKSISVVGDSSIVYASTKALYVVSTQYPIYYDFYNYQERSAVYKFALGDPLQFEGMGFVNGRGLNQFSLSEYEDILRIAVTEGDTWQGKTANALYTLESNGSALNLKGYLGSLGEELETIRAVRLIGERGYVVTFVQTDPLYTLDLSDPANPKKVGELKVDGFSEYIHPIDSNRLLTIGRDADSNGVTQGVSIQLFDVSDFANPKLASKISIGDNTYYSQAEYDHKAFIYRQSDQLFSVPYTTWYGGQMYYPLYQINGLSISKLGEVNIYNDYSCDPRSVIYDFGGSSHMASFCSAEAVTLDIVK